ncbi:MAG: OB-fold nucleic acid binding domain-containing protein [Nanoarchaeota archaeon]|nr:OB-fold nucleic acid binding domain-containing protein [Nanoarchaeota archaeon]
MMNVPFEEMLAAICEKSKLPKEAVEEKVKAKMEQLSGLISKEGACHIIANELGVSLQEARQPGSVKLKDLKQGMRDIETAGAVTGTYDAKEFKRQDGSSGKVASILIADETGRARIVLWNDAVEKLKEATPGIVVKIQNPFIKQSQYGLELHHNSDTKLVFNPSDVTIASQAGASRKNISELAPGQIHEILGTVVQMFEPRYFEVCPSCGRRARLRESTYFCDSHGAVSPEYSYVLNCVIDDGTATIRGVFFSKQSDALLGMQHHQMLTFKEAPAGFQAVKDKMLGKIVKLAGRVSKNDMFDRLEFVAQSVDTEPSAEAELARLERSDA